MLSGDRTADLYQLHAYTRVLGLSSGALITCIADDTASTAGDKIRVRNTDTDLYLWPIDLRGTPAEIEAELAGLADWVADASERAVH